MNIWKSMKIIYENCGVKNFLKEDHRSYRRNFFPYQLEIFFRLSLRDCKSCVYNCNDLLSWLISSVGKIRRALHRYGRGQGCESRTSLNFFRAFFSQLQTVRLNYNAHLSNNTSGIVTMVREKPFPSFKTRLSTKPFVWKWVLFAWALQLASL